MKENFLLWKLAGVLLSFYMTTAIFAGVYYNWQFARDHTFMEWLFFGQIVPSAKALIWPYFAFAQGPNFKFPEIIASLLSGFLSGLFSLWVLGLALIWSVLTWMSAHISKYPPNNKIYAFVVGLGSSYSASFVFNMIALAIQGSLPPRNIILPVCTWLVLSIYHLSFAIGILQRHIVKSSILGLCRKRNNRCITSLHCKSSVHHDIHSSTTFCGCNPP